MGKPKGKARATNKNAKNVKKLYSQDSVESRLAQLLFKFILKRNPDHKKPDLEMWASHIDAMIRIDNREVEEIEAVIRWCQSEDTKESRFWNNSILSTEKLRLQFDQLKLKMEADKTKQNPPEINRPPNEHKIVPTPARTQAGKDEFRRLSEQAKKKSLNKVMA